MARSYAKSGKERKPQHEDVFVERILEATAWAQENLTAVVVSTLILALGVAGILYYRNYQERVREQAAVQLQSLAAALTGMEPAAAADTLQSFVERYRDTDAAAEARALLGRVRLDAGAPAAAIEVLRPAAEHPPDTPIGYAARTLLAAAHERQGESVEALRLYDQLASSARLPFQRRRAAADRARLLLADGRFSEGAEIYEDLARRAEEADAPGEAADYRLRAGEARALAVAEDPATADGAPETAGSGG